MKPKSFPLCYVCALTMSLLLFAGGTTNLKADEAESQAVETQAHPFEMTYGHGGPTRAWDKPVFAGEILFFALRFPENFFPVDKVTDAVLDFSFASESNRTQFIRSPSPAVLDIPILNERPVTLLLPLAIPRSFEAGTHIMRITATNRQGDILLHDERRIDVLDLDSFGIRNLMFEWQVPGTEHWAPASNVFVVGEVIRLAFQVGGIPVHLDTEAGELETIVEVAIKDDETGIVSRRYIGGSPSYRFALNPYEITRDNTSRGFWLSLPIHQAGNYTITATFTDVISQKTDSRTIPLIVHDRAR